MTDAVTRGLQPIPLHGLLFDVAGASAQGPRAENQDAFDVDAFAARGLVAVADGMGGERAGRLAADTALRTLAEGSEIRSLDAARYAVRYADEAVARAAQEAPDARGGMGCALALMALTVDRAGEVGWIGAHVGDVRILSRSPDGMVRLETRDHTPAYARWEAGEIALDEIPDSPGANRLQRAVGRGGEAEASWIPVRAGWTFLLISDGVTKAMRLDELGGAMALSSAAAICEAVTRKVEERGPDDNYTAVAVRVLDGGGGDTIPDPRPRPSAAPPTIPSAPPAAAAPPANAPRNLINTPEDVDVPRRSSPLPLIIALLALALGGYAAWAATQGRGADPAVAAQIDSLRAEVAALRAAAAPADSLADTTASAVIGAPGPAGPAAPQTGAGAPPAAPAGGKHDARHPHEPMTDFTPATRPTEHASEEPLLDSFLREAIPEIKLALGDLIDRDNSRAIPDKYVKLLPLTTLVVTLRPDAAQAVAPMAAELEGDLTDSVMRHGSLYDRDYRVRLREAGQKGAPLFRVSVQPAGEPEPAPIVPAPASPERPAPPSDATYAALREPEARPAAPPLAETLFAGRAPEVVDPDATRVEGIPHAPARPAPGPEAPALPAGRFELVSEEEDGTERERFPLTQAVTTVGRQTDNPALRSDVQLTGWPNVSRRQLALVHAHRDGREGFDVYNLGLNSIHVGEREVSGANAGKGPLQLEGMDAHSLFVPPGESIRIGGHGPVVRIGDRGGAKGGGEPTEVRVEPEVEDDPDRTQFG